MAHCGSASLPIGILWVNDSRIVDGRCIKFYAPPEAPGWIEIEVSHCLDAVI